LLFDADAAAGGAWRCVEVGGTSQAVSAAEDEPFTQTPGISWAPPCPVELDGLGGSVSVSRLSGEGVETARGTNIALAGSYVVTAAAALAPAV